MKKVTALLLALVMLLCLAACGTTADTAAESEGETVSTVETVAFSGGSGTEEAPWIISSVDELLAFAASVNDGSCYGYAGSFIRLDADLDLKKVDWKPIGTMEDMENGTTMFLGDFNGNGHTISNLTYHTDEDQPVIAAGLFGMSSGDVHDLKLKDADVEVLDPNGMAIGGVVGYEMGGTLYNLEAILVNEIKYQNHATT